MEIILFSVAAFFLGISFTITLIIWGKYKRIKVKLDESEEQKNELQGDLIEQVVENIIKEVEK